PPLDQEIRFRAEQHAGALIQHAGKRGFRRASSLQVRSDLGKRAAIETEQRHRTGEQDRRDSQRPTARRAPDLADPESEREREKRADFQQVVVVRSGLADGYYKRRREKEIDREQRHLGIAPQAVEVEEARKQREQE